LIERATSNQPWVAPLVRRGDGFKPNTADTHEAAVAYLTSCYPSLTFVTWWLNGADDVVKYKKWEKAGENSRRITMGRPGDTEAVAAAIQQTPLDPNHFLLGPEMPDVSSTKVRALLRARDDRALTDMLHPAVMAWCYENSPYQPR